MRFLLLLVPVFTFAKVYSPTVVEGELALEASHLQTFDADPAKDGFIKQNIGFEYGLTSYWKAEFSLEIEKESDASTAPSNVKVENILTPFKPGELWCEFGIYLELEKAVKDIGPYNFEPKLLIEKNFDPIVATLNIGVNREFGANSTANIDAAASALIRYRLDKKFEPGLEYVTELGTLSKDSDPGVESSESSHQIGPNFRGKINSFVYDVAALIGLDAKAPNTTIDLNLEYEF